MHIDSGKEFLENRSDEELVRCYHEGNNAGLGLLVTKYLELIDKKLRGFPGLKGESDDAKQEALISLVNAIKTYDESKQTSFSTYASRCIDNAIRNFAEGLSAKKVQSLKTAIPMEEADLSHAFDFTKDDPEKIYIDKEQFSLLMKTVVMDLSEFERNVLFYYLEGKSYAQISSTLHCSSKAVDNALQRIRKKAKTAFNR